MLFGWSGLGLTKVQAAESSWNNIETAKKAVANVAPGFLPTKVMSVSSTNNAATENFLQKPLVAETQITPEPKPKIVVKSTTTTRTTKPVAVASQDGDLNAHRFPYGYCTYYVSQQRFIPWSGNAIAWLSGAQSYGYATGNSPQVGAIVVTSEGGRTGHVGMVTAVGEGTITITEMNYEGFGVVSSRTIAANYGRILGYIY